MKKMEKKYKKVLLIAAELFLICGVPAQSAGASSIPMEKSMAAIIKNNELLLIDLKNNKAAIIIDKGGMFSHPIISPGKDYIAYLKDTALYVSGISGKKSKVLDNAPSLSYNWLNKNELMYSPESGGIYIFDAEKREIKPYIKNDSNYQNITPVNDEKIYAEKYRYYKKNGYNSIQDYGIAEIQTGGKKEQIIINSIPSDNEGSLGMFPVIAGISKDLRLLYIFEHPHSASMATDGVGFGSYDIKLNNYKSLKNTDIITLPYRDNISSCERNSELLAFINGGGREMNSNKTLGILNVVTGTFEKLSQKDQAAMTPYYSPNCKNVLYASSRTLGSIENINEWMHVKHPIYSININTMQITQLTDYQYGFDFAPVYIDDKDIVFLRMNISDGTISMLKLRDGKESKLADDLIFYNDKYKVQHFYGHLDVSNYVDIK
jgi:bla regulator protein BlaR1